MGPRAWLDLEAKKNEPQSLVTILYCLSNRNIKNSLHRSSLSYVPWNPTVLLDVSRISKDKFLYIRFIINSSIKINIKITMFLFQTVVANNKKNILTCHRYSRPWQLHLNIRLKPSVSPCVSDKYKMKEN
jgi:hypothetical protein